PLFGMYPACWPIEPSTSACGRSRRSVLRGATAPLATACSVSGAPTRAAFFETVMTTGYSLLFAATIASCWDAASLPMPLRLNDSLSRSTAQKSQPRLEGLSGGPSHGVLPSPCEHTSSAPHVSTCEPLVPSWLQR